MDLLARNSLRIVHVEDNDDFAFVSEVWLKRAGFKQPIVRCTDGRRALHHFLTLEPENKPDVILLDLHMPHLDGLEVLHWLRHYHNEPDIAVFLLTSSNDPEDRRQAMANHVTGYLLKAPLFDELIQNLDHLIAIRNKERLDEVSRLCDVMAESVYTGESSVEMAVV